MAHHTSPHSVMTHGSRNDVPHEQRLYAGQWQGASHLPALCDDAWQLWPVGGPRRHHLDLPDHQHAVPQHAAKHLPRYGWMVAWVGGWLRRMPSERHPGTLPRPPTCRPPQHGQTPVGSWARVGGWDGEWVGGWGGGWVGGWDAFHESGPQHAMHYKRPRATVELGAAWDAMQLPSTCTAPNLICKHA